MELNDDDVVSFSHADYNVANLTTATVKEIKKSLLDTLFTRYLSAWIYGGTSCKVLSANGGGWQPGKIRFRLEFVPDEPIQTKVSGSTNSNSPLDDLRSSMDIQ
ncbi:hypothetical protein NIES4103_31420 [Nostoc sp. NIES-4103]|nr:hypothetical protein NIES4103_31420 [Nostoc sp. NIES-4103]